MSALDAFTKANTRSPIVSGFAIGRGGEGAVYVLQNGQEFRLTAAECEKAAPRWKLTPQRRHSNG
jgi:ribosomal protein L24E